MKIKSTIIAAVAAAAFSLTQSVQAVPITGTIGFSGSVYADSGNPATATEIYNWGPSIISLNDGIFSSLSSAATVAFANNWFLNSFTPVNNFWVVTDGSDQYIFTLSSSAIISTVDTVSATVVLAGTVTSTIAGLSPTAFTGSFTLQNPNSPQPNNVYKYSSSISFTSVPDGGTTVMLLGAALSGLALIKRKLVA